MDRGVAGWSAGRGAGLGRMGHGWLGDGVMGAGWVCSGRVWNWDGRSGGDGAGAGAGGRHARRERGRALQRCESCSLRRHVSEDIVGGLPGREVVGCCERRGGYVFAATALSAAAVPMRLRPTTT